jgi:hypothetical protein
VGYRRDGSELVIHTSCNAYTPGYAIKVLRDLGGTPVDFNTREPSDEQLYAMPAGEGATSIVEPPIMASSSKVTGSVARARPASSDPASAVSVTMATAGAAASSLRTGPLQPG